MPGEHAIGPPDFVGVGTHLSGSEWWMGALNQHPRVTGPRHGRRRALFFFERFCNGPISQSDIDDYHGYFPRGPGVVCGEWSNRYAYDVWTLPLIRRAAPEAKIMMMVRDPIERYKRSLGHRRGRINRRGSRRSKDKPVYMTEEAHRGRYGSHLRAVRQFFDAEKILVLQLEECLRDPLGQYARTLRFLGVDDGFAPRQLRRPPRRDGSPVEQARLLRPYGLPPGLNLHPLRRLAGRPVPESVELWDELQGSLVAELSPEVVALREHAPELDLELWPSFAHLARS